MSRSTLVLAALALAACGSKPQDMSKQIGEPCTSDSECPFVFPYSNCVSWGGTTKVCSQQCQPNGTGAYACATNDCRYTGVGNKYLCRPDTVTADGTYVGSGGGGTTGGGGTGGCTAAGSYMCADIGCVNGNGCQTRLFCREVGSNSCLSSTSSFDTAGCKSAVYYCPGP